MRILVFLSFGLLVAGCTLHNQVNPDRDDHASSGVVDGSDFLGERLVLMLDRNGSADLVEITPAAANGFYPMSVTLFPSKISFENKRLAATPTREGIGSVNPVHRLRDQKNGSFTYAHMIGAENFGALRRQAYTFEWIDGKLELSEYDESHQRFLEKTVIETACQWKFGQLKVKEREDNSRVPGGSKGAWETKGERVDLPGPYAFASLDPDVFSRACEILEP